MIKKVFVELMNFLEENKLKKISTVMPDILALVSAKSTSGLSTTVRKDEFGVTTHILCYYHKLWEPVDEVDFGVKNSSVNGLNNMCKEGTAHYGKQQRIALKARSELTDQAIGGATPEELTLKADGIELARINIVPRKDGVGSSE